MISIICHFYNRREVEAAILICDSESDSDSDLEDLLLTEWHQLQTPLIHSGDRMTLERLLNTEVNKVINDFRFTARHIEQLSVVLALPNTYTAPNGTVASG